MARSGGVRAFLRTGGRQALACRRGRDPQAGRSEPDGAGRGMDEAARQLHGAGNARAGLRRCPRSLPAEGGDWPARPASRREARRELRGSQARSCRPLPGRPARAMREGSRRCSRSAERDPSADCRASRNGGSGGRGRCSAPLERGGMARWEGGKSGIAAPAEGGRARCGGHDAGKAGLLALESPSDPENRAGQTGRHP